jgi:hypothetical protein
MTRFNVNSTSGPDASVYEQCNGDQRAFNDFGKIFIALYCYEYAT